MDRALFWQQQNYFGVDLTPLYGSAFQEHFSQPVVDAFDPRLLVAPPTSHMRSCAYYPKFGFGASGIFPFLSNKRVSSEDYGVMGLRYGSGNLSFGAAFMPLSFMTILSVPGEFPKNAWLISKMGRLIVGVQYEPQLGSKDVAKYKNLNNWMGYRLGSVSPLSPSFNYALELAKSSGFIALFYQHFVVQRPVNNQFEENEIVGIANYIDFGFELKARVDDVQLSKTVPDSAFHIAASWQANKNFLVKEKVGPLSSSVALAFKSWCKPSFTFSVSGFDILAMNHEEDSGASDLINRIKAFWEVARNYWLPCLLVFLVATSWSNPIILAAKVTLFLIGTRPSLLSMYLVVEKRLVQLLTSQFLYSQMCNQSHNELLHFFGK
ncbi:LOW QUALITY PROTEIN: hypothetical protein RJ641_000412, partial [Dillenia turbinata]